MMILHTTWCGAQQVTYHTSHLQRVANTLNLTNILDTIATGTSLTTLKGQKIEVRISEGRQVEHIGLPLFSLQQRLLSPLPVYDYLEQVTLNHKYSIVDNPLSESQISFRVGTWKTMEKIPEKASCSITNIDNKLYKVTWSDAKTKILEVTFPSEYSVQSNASRRESEDNFIRDLKDYVPQHQDVSHYMGVNDLEPMDGGLYFLQGEPYLLDNITSDLYYRKIPKSKEACLFVDDKLAAMSLPNILLSGDSAISNCKIKLKFIKTEGRTDSLLIPVRNLTLFCLTNGCRGYWGIEGASDKTIEGSLFFYNKDAGYDHVIYISAPITNIGNKEYIIRGKVYLYTPTSNVKSLFGDQMKTKKKTIKFD